MAKSINYLAIAAASKENVNAKQPRKRQDRLNVINKSANLVPRQSAQPTSERVKLSKNLANASVWKTTVAVGMSSVR